MKQKTYNLPLILAVSLHVLILALLFISFRWNSQHKPPATAATNIVNAITIDAKQLQSQITKREFAEEEKHQEVKQEAEKLQQAAVLQQKQEQAHVEQIQHQQQQAEKQQLEKQHQAAAELAQLKKQQATETKKLAALQKLHEVELAEKKHLAAEEAKQAVIEKNKKAAEEKQKREEKKQTELAEKKKAEAERKKLAAEKKLKEAKREKEAKQKLEKSLQQQLAKEAKHDLEKSMQKQLTDEETQLSSSKATQAELSEIDKFKTQILQAIAQRWLVPDDVDRGLSCKLQIRLAPSGAVLNVTLAKSSGDAALDRSAIAAVYKASPLPVPDTALFDKFRELSLTVRPEAVL